MGDCIKFKYNPKMAKLIDIIDHADKKRLNAIFKNKKKIYDLISVWHPI